VNLSTTFAQPPAQHLAAFPRRVAYSGRPSGGAPSPGALTGHPSGRSIGQRPQVSKGTELLVTPARFSADALSIRHKNPKAQPFCATCGAWLPEYPFNATNLCESCSTQTEG